MNKLLLKLNLQLFAECEDKDKEKESETVKVIKEEYEKKIKEQHDKYEKELSDLRKNHIEEIRALVSGRSENLSEETKKLQEKKELSYEEQLLKDTREQMGLKGGK